MAEGVPPVRPASGPLTTALGPLTTASLLQVFGGVRGLFDSSLAATVFVLALLVASLDVAVGAAVVAGLLVVVVRRVRGQSMQQAAGGFLGLLLAVLVARTTGSGKGFFLPGILLTAGSGVVFAVSLLLRRPVVAVALSAMDPRYEAWRELPALRRACVISTAVWAGSFFVRAGVATTVALATGDGAGDSVLLLVVINAVKWPLIIGSTLLTVALVRQADAAQALPLAAQESAPPAS